MGDQFESSGPCVCGFGNEFFTLEGDQHICTVCGGIVGIELSEIFTPVETEEREKSILIVDDQPFFRNKIREILTEYGHEVIEASDGLGGVKILAEMCLQAGFELGGIDCLILDLIMPGELDGFQTMAVVKAILPDMPVIILTARPPTKELLQKLAKLGAKKYINKSAGNLEQLILKNISEVII